MFGFDGSFSSTMQTTDNSFAIFGESTWSYIGQYGFTIGDLDGDGSNDVVMSMPYLSNSGEVSIFLGGGL